MFYKVCLAIAIGIFTLSLIGSFTPASSLTVRQQNFVDSTAQSRIRTPYIVPIPYGYSTGGGGSSRSSYDGYRGGGPGTGK